MRYEYIVCEEEICKFMESRNIENEEVYPSNDERRCHIKIRSEDWRYFLCYASRHKKYDCQYYNSNRHGPLPNRVCISFSVKVLRKYFIDDIRLWICDREKIVFRFVSSNSSDARSFLTTCKPNQKRRDVTAQRY